MSLKDGSRNLNIGVIIGAIALKIPNIKPASENIIWLVALYQLLWRFCEWYRESGSSPAIFQNCIPPLEPGALAKTFSGEIILECFQRIPAQYFNRCVTAFDYAFGKEVFKFPVETRPGQPYQPA